ncbi:MAG: Creatinine amidohydrolase [Syntrophomonadaceae bacterium]|nr:Creatinine amidohydrolase [Bacillota bacterium]
MKLAHRTWQEVKDAKADLVLVPIGSFEQHGYHLPLNNDSFVAERLSETVIQELKKEGTNAVMTPALPFGLSPHHMSFAGTITLRREIFEGAVVDICQSLVQHGLRKIVLVNGHGGNSQALRAAVDTLKERSDVEDVRIFEYWTHLNRKAVRENIESNFFCHACEGETSLSIALGQEFRPDRLVEEFPPEIENEVCNLLERSDEATRPFPRVDTISSSGVIGNSTLASAEKGKRMLDALVEEFRNFRPNKSG